MHISIFQQLLLLYKTINLQHSKCYHFTSWNIRHINFIWQGGHISHKIIVDPLWRQEFSLSVEETFSKERFSKEMFSNDKNDSHKMMITYTHRKINFKLFLNQPKSDFIHHFRYIYTQQLYFNQNNYLTFWQG